MAFFSKRILRPKLIKLICLIDNKLCPIHLKTAFDERVSGERFGFHFFK